MEDVPRIVELSVGRMRAEHIDRVRQIEQLSFPDRPAYLPWQEELAKRYGLALNVSIVGIESQGRYETLVTGAAVMRSSSAISAWDIEITFLAVHPEFRRLGHARLLLKNGLRQLVTDDMETASVRIRPGNVEARAFFEAVGFSFLAEEPGHYEDGENAMVLWCNDVKRPGMLY